MQSSNPSNSSTLQTLPTQEVMKSSNPSGPSTLQTLPTPEVMMKSSTPSSPPTTKLSPLPTRKQIQETNSRYRTPEWRSMFASNTPEDAGRPLTGLELLLKARPSSGKPTIRTFGRPPRVSSAGGSPQRYSRSQGISPRPIKVPPIQSPDARSQPHSDVHNLTLPSPLIQAEAKSPNRSPNSEPGTSPGSNHLLASALGYLPAGLQVQSLSSPSPTPSPMFPPLSHGHNYPSPRLMPMSESVFEASRTRKRSQFLHDSTSPISIPAEEGYLQAPKMCRSPSLDVVLASSNSASECSSAQSEKAKDWEALLRSRWLCQQLFSFMTLSEVAMLGNVSKTFKLRSRTTPFIRAVDIKESCGNFTAFVGREATGALNERIRLNRLMQFNLTCVEAIKIRLSPNLDTSTDESTGFCPTDDIFRSLHDALGSCSNLLYAKITTRMPDCGTTFQRIVEKIFRGESLRQLILDCKGVMLRPELFEALSPCMDSLYLGAPVTVPFDQLLNSLPYTIERITLCTQGMDITTADLHKVFKRYPVVNIVGDLPPLPTKILQNQSVYKTDDLTLTSTKRMKEDGVILSKVFSRLPKSLKRLTLNDMHTRGQCHAQWWQEVGWAIMDGLEYLDLRYHKIADVKQMLEAKGKDLRNMQTLKLKTAQTVRRVKKLLKCLLPSHVSAEFRGMEKLRSARKSTTASPIFNPSPRTLHTLGALLSPKLIPRESPRW